MRPIAAATVQQRTLGTFRAARCRMAALPGRAYRPLKSHEMALIHETFATFCDVKGAQTSSHASSWNERVPAIRSGRSSQALCTALAAWVSAVRLTEVVVSTPPDK